MGNPTGLEPEALDLSESGRVRPRQGAVYPILSSSLEASPPCRAGCVHPRLRSLEDQSQNVKDGDWTRVPDLWRSALHPSWNPGVGLVTGPQEVTSPRRKGGGQSIVVNCSDTGELAGLLARRVTTWDMPTTPAQEPGGQTTEEAAKEHSG